MAVEAESKWFESMGFSPYAHLSSHDFLMGSAVSGIEDGFFSLNPLVDSYQNLHAPSSSSSSSLASFGSVPVEIVQSLSSELEKQRVEMDWFLQLESTRLRRLILEEIRTQQEVLMLKYESRIKIQMLQKEEELAVARNRTRELQDFLKAAEIEARAWEKKATEKEAIVSDLNNRLTQVKKKKKDDAVSFCDSSSSAGGRKAKIKR